MILELYIILFHMKTSYEELRSFTALAIFHVGHNNYTYFVTFLLLLTAKAFVMIIWALFLPASFPDISSQQQSLLSQCNSGCACSLKHWDPVCAFNGLTYSTPCLAGCQSSTGFGKKMVSFSDSNSYLFTPNSHT